MACLENVDGSIYVLTREGVEKTSVITRQLDDSGLNQTTKHNDDDFPLRFHFYRATAIVLRMILSRNPSHASVKKSMPANPHASPTNYAHSTTARLTHYN